MSEHVWIVGVSGATRFYAALAALFPPTSQRSGCAGVKDNLKIWLFCAMQSIAKISAESLYLWPRNHQRSAISWQLCQRRYLLPNFCRSPCCLKSYSQVSRLSAALASHSKAFSCCFTLAQASVIIQSPPPTLLKRDSVMQLSKYRQCSSTKFIIWDFTFAIWTIFSQSHAAQRSVDFWTRPQHPRGFSWRLINVN